MACVSQLRGRGFDSRLVRGNSGLKIATFKQESSTRSTLSQLRLESVFRVRELNFHSSGWKIATFAREVHFRSSGWKIATFKYESSAQSTLAQLRLENRNF